MARANPTPFIPSGYSDWPIRRCIAEAVNVCRYSPWKAHEWMEEAAARLDIMYAPYFDEYNNAVKRINAMWKKHRQYRWFNEREFWKDGKTSTISSTKSIIQL